MGTAARRELFLQRTAFSIGAHTLRWADVVSAARVWREWPAVEERARQKASLLHHARAQGGDVDGTEVRTAERAFRRGRRLYSADDYEQWLSGWGLTVEDHREHLRAAILEGRSRDDTGDAVMCADLARLVHAEAVLSGDLECLANKLAARAAIYHRTERRRAWTTCESDLSSMEDGFARFCESVATAEAIAREIRSNRLDWVRIRCRCLRAATAAVAREAALCVRQDGRDLASVAEEAGLDLTEWEVELGCAEPVVQAALSAAQPGELLGPLRLGESHLLLLVLTRNKPSVDDAEVRARAERSVVARAVAHEVQARVRWPDPAPGT